MLDQDCGIFTNSIEYQNSKLGWRGLYQKQLTPLQETNVLNGIFEMYIMKIFQQIQFTSSDSGGHNELYFDLVLFMIHIYPHVLMDLVA